jgi:regulator of replication initiation timing
MVYILLLSQDGRRSIEMIRRISGKGNIYKEDARLGELERVIGQLYTENSFLKKALSNLEMRLQEQRRKDTQR